jgi:hypothetical protein
LNLLNAYDSRLQITITLSPIYTLLQITAAEIKFTLQPEEGSAVTRVEAGSNTSTVTLRVVGGDEKGSFKSEIIKYGRKSQGTKTRERLRWQGPAAHTKDRSVLSSERAPHGIKNVTVRRISYSERRKNLVLSPGWVLYTKTDWPTDRRS